MRDFNRASQLTQTASTYVFPNNNLIPSIFRAHVLSPLSMKKENSTQTTQPQIFKKNSSSCEQPLSSPPHAHSDGLPRAARNNIAERLVYFRHV